MWRTAGARLWAVGLAATLASAAASTCVPPLGTARRVVTVARGVATGEAQRAGELGVPRDLQFHPLTGDLWVAAASADGRLNGNFIISKPGTAEQSTTPLRDRVAYHYMDNVSAFAFSSDGRALFTCQESLNEYMELSFPNYFQGPSAFEVYPCKGGYGRPPKSKCVGAQNAPNCNSDEECCLGCGEVSRIVRFTGSAERGSKCRVGEPWGRCAGGLARCAWGWECPEAWDCGRGA